MEVYCYEVHLCKNNGNNNQQCNLFTIIIAFFLFSFQSSQVLIIISITIIPHY